MNLTEFSYRHGKMKRKFTSVGSHLKNIGEVSKGNINSHQESNGFYKDLDGKIHRYATFQEVLARLQNGGKA